MCADYKIGDYLPKARYASFDEVCLAALDVNMQSYAGTWVTP